MNSGVGMWYGTHFSDDLLERILLRKHIKQISPSANYFLNSFRVQKFREPHSIKMTVCFHLEYELADMAEAKATMPPSVCQDVIGLAVMSIPCLARLISMN